MKQKILTVSLLGNHFKVTYKPKAQGVVPDYIEIHIESDGSLAIRGHDGRLVVRAEVSNKINVSLEKYA